MPRIEIRIVNLILFVRGYLEEQRDRVYLVLWREGQISTSQTFLMANLSKGGKKVLATAKVYLETGSEKEILEKVVSHEFGQQFGKLITNNLHKEVLPIKNNLRRFYELTYTCLLTPEDLSTMKLPYNSGGVELVSMEKFRQMLKEQRKRNEHNLVQTKRQFKKLFKKVRPIRLFSFCDLPEEEAKMAEESYAIWQEKIRKEIIKRSKKPPVRYASVA